MKGASSDKIKKIRLKITTNTGILQIVGYLSVVCMLVLWGGHVHVVCMCTCIKNVEGNPKCLLELAST